MSLSAIDIKAQEFALTLRGYDRSEVRRFLNSVGEAMAKLNGELTEERNQRRQEQRELEILRQREESLKDAMVTAQRATETLREQAKNEAEIIRSQAEVRAEKILLTAQKELYDLQDNVHDIRGMKVRLTEELRSLLNVYHRLLDVQTAEAGPGRNSPPGLAPEARPRPRARA